MSQKQRLRKLKTRLRVNVKKKLLGSIFTRKLIFEEENYRTTGLNEAVALISLFQKELENKKGRFLFGKRPVMPRIGLEPTHLAIPEPKSGVSTNFTTWAKKCKIYNYFRRFLPSCQCLIK